MTDSILSEFYPAIAAWMLVPGRGGVFEVELDGELVYSKRATGRHASIEEIREAFLARVDPNLRVPPGG